MFDQHKWEVLVYRMMNSGIKFISREWGLQLEWPSKRIMFTKTCCPLGYFMIGHNGPQKVEEYDELPWAEYCAKIIGIPLKQVLAFTRGFDGYCCICSSEEERSAYTVGKSFWSWAAKNDRVV